MLNNKVLLLSLLSSVALNATELVTYQPQQDLALYSKENRIAAINTKNQQLQLIDNLSIAKTLKDVANITNKFCKVVFEKNQLEVIEYFDLKNITKEIYDEAKNEMIEFGIFNKFDIGEKVFKAWSKACKKLKESLQESFFDKKGLQRHAVRIIQLELILFYLANY